MSRQLTWCMGVDIGAESSSLLNMGAAIGAAHNPKRYTMSAKLKVAILKAACAVAREIENDEVVTLDRANTLLRHVHEGIQQGMTVDAVWAEIARDGGFQDKAAKLEGKPMGKLLQQYRSRQRKGEKLGANFGLSWGLFLADIKRLSESERAPRPGSNESDSVVQTTGKGEDQLSAVVLPPAIKVLLDKRAGMTVEKRAVFDAKLTAWASAYGI